MKMDLAVPVLVALAVSLHGCAPPAEDTEAGGMEEQATAAAGQEAFRALVEDFDAAVSSEDLDALMALFVAEPVTLPPGGPPATGARDFRRVWGDMFAQGDVEVDNEARRIWVSGDLAAAWGTFTIQIEPAEGEPAEDAGKWMAVWERQEDGTWKAVANIWNSDTQPAAAAP